MTRVQEDSSASSNTVIYRLDLPSELAETLAREAELNERTLPGQVRFALREWIANRTATAG
jgi:hypothetical protein